MTAYYNENDPRMANVLRELIHEGLIASGIVDDRSIVDVRGSDLRGFDQCHFFAGIGVWSHALRRAGWPDYRPCWTGSCPCQPFSLAGSGRGFDDPRHLWPYWFRLIVECGPGRIFGEQVASASEWLDLVAADLEGHAYTFAAVDLAAAGFSGAHIRQRFFWVADAYDAEWWADHAPRHLGDWSPAGRLEGDSDAAGCGPDGGVADSGSEDGQRLWSQFDSQSFTGPGAPPRGEYSAGRRDAGSLGNASHERHEGGLGSRRWGLRSADASPIGGVGHHHHQGLALRPGPVDERGAIRLEGPALSAPGPLFGCDWLLCHDAKIRPVEPGTFPLAVEAPARVGRLHGYGNAIDAEAATQFLSAYIAAAENAP